MRLKIKFIFVVILSISTSLAQHQRYCNPELCKNHQGSVHIGCPGVAKSSCPNDVRSIDMTSDLQQLILDGHNKHRNNLAGGNLTGFSQATRMPTIEWGPELASLANIHVMQCNFDHDKCRNTPRFKYCGQNLYMAHTTFDVKQQISNAIDLWWDEYKVFPKDLVNKFESRSNFMQFGHFSVMIQDRITRVGCAMSNYSKNTYLFTCNYSFTNMIGQTIYKVGKTASECKTGVNPNFHNLCSTAEDVNPNELNIR